MEMKALGLGVIQITFIHESQPLHKRHLCGNVGGPLASFRQCGRLNSCNGN